MFLSCFSDERQQFVVEIPDDERATWMWVLIFAYFIPEIGTFFRSVRIIFFKSWEYPTASEFSWTAVTELFPAIGSAIFVFMLLPEMDAIRAAMLTNALCFIPAVVGKFTKKMIDLFLQIISKCKLII